MTNQNPKLFSNLFIVLVSISVCVAFVVIEEEISESESERPIQTMLRPIWTTTPGNIEVDISEGTSSRPQTMLCSFLIVILLILWQ